MLDRGFPVCGLSLLLCLQEKVDFLSIEHPFNVQLVFSSILTHCCCPLSAITYKVVIKTGKQLGGSTTTAQAWMTLAGSIADTGVMNIPKNENEFRFQVKIVTMSRKSQTGLVLGFQKNRGSFAVLHKTLPIISLLYIMSKKKYAFGSFTFVFNSIQTWVC